MLTHNSAVTSAHLPRMAALRRLFSPAERIYIFFALSVVSGGFLWMLGEAQEGTADDSSALARVVLLPIYGVMGWLILDRPKGFMRTAARGIPTLCLAAFAILSTAWSIDPQVTLRRSIAFVAPTLFGILLAQRFRTQELMRLLAWTLGIGAILSVLVGLGMPEKGISTMEYGSAWQGVYGTKNILGKVMSLGVILFVLLGMDAQRQRWMPWLMAAVCASLVVLSKSASSLVVTAVTITMIPLVRSLQLRGATAAGVWTAAVMFGAILLTIVVSSYEPILTALGRDTTLTGRTELWAVVVATIIERPWLGFGYSAFWQGWSGTSAPLMEAIGWSTPHAHNGFLDMTLDLGVVGLMLFIASFIVVLIAALRRARMSTGAYEMWPLLFLMLLLLINLSESSLLRQHNLFWILYVAVGCSDLLAYRRMARSGAPAGVSVAAHAPVRTRGTTLGVRRAAKSRFSGD